MKRACVTIKEWNVLNPSMPTFLHAQPADSVCSLECCNLLKRMNTNIVSLGFYSSFK